MNVHTDPKALVKYHEDHLVSDSAKSDYYSQGNHVTGNWFGKGAEKLGLVGAVEKTAFERLCYGLHPVTGKQLALRKKDNARSCFDLVFLPPKSVGIMAEVMDDTRILDAHELTVSELLAEIEKLAMVRVRIAGQNTDRPAGNIIAACFTHHTSRANDPLPHTHCIIPNIAFDPIEQRYKALQAVEFFRKSGLLTEMYRSRMAARLHNLGYPTVATAHGFEVAGVSREVIDLFSKRHQQIEAIATAAGKADNMEFRDGVTRCSREEKDTSLSVAELRVKWGLQLSKEQSEQLAAIKANAVAPIVLPMADAKNAITLAADHLFERRSVVTREALFQEGLAANRGLTDIPELQAAFEKMSVEGAFLVSGDEVTTPAAVAAEKALIETVDSAVGTCMPLNPDFVPCYAPALSYDQRDAVSFLLNCKDPFSALRGPAGAGKTTTLRELHDGLRSGGHSVLFCAPTASAVAELKKTGFENALTLQRFQCDKNQQAAIRNGVIVIDEAGLTSLNQLNDLFALAKELNCRTLLVGDAAQHKSTAAGDSLRILEAHSRIARVELTSIRRQTHKGYREAVTHLKDGNTKDGLDKLDDLGWVHQCTATTRYQRIADEVLNARVDRKSCLVVCATWNEGDRITSHVRAALQDKGLLSTEEYMVKVLHPLQWTRSHLGQLHRYEPGMVIVCNKKCKLFARGEELTVTDVRDKFVVVTRLNGETHLIKPKQMAKRIAVYESRHIPLAKGDQILIRKNGLSGNGRKLVNGELVTVRAAYPGNFITLEDGRTIPPTFRHFSHGYAVTSQCSQGKTVDRVIIAIEAKTAMGATSRETLYVAASRGKERCTIFTDSKELLTQAFRRSSERKSALEFLQQANNPQKDPAYEKPTVATRPGEPIPATRLDKDSPRLDHPNRSQSPRGGTDALLRAQSSHPDAHHPGTQLPDQPPLRRLHRDGGQPSGPAFQPQEEQLSFAFMR